MEHSTSEQELRAKFDECRRFRQEGLNPAWQHDEVERAEELAARTRYFEACKEFAKLVGMSVCRCAAYINMNRFDLLMEVSREL